LSDITLVVGNKKSPRGCNSCYQELSNKSDVLWGTGC